MEVLSAEPRPPAANRRSRRPTRAALLFGYFLLGKQEKVTRSQDASGKHRDVSRSSRNAEDNSKWIPASAGMTDEELDSSVRRNDGVVQSGLRRNDSQSRTMCGRSRSNERDG